MLAFWTSRKLLYSKNDGVLECNKKHDEITFSNARKIVEWSFTNTPRIKYSHLILVHIAFMMHMMVHNVYKMPLD